MSRNSLSWSILQYKPNAYKIAKRNLDRQKFETFMPFEEIQKYKNKQICYSKRPLFPGYMFVAFESEASPWQKINSTQGVSKLLTLNNQPHIVPRDFMANIKVRCNKEGILIPPKHLSKGDNVRIVSDPFSGFFATIENINRDQRVWVLIDLLGQATKLLVNTEKLLLLNK